MRILGSRRYFLIPCVALVLLVVLAILVGDLLLPPQRLGTLLILVSTADDLQLHYIDAALGRVEVLHGGNPAISNAQQVTLSPDGKWLAFMAYDDQNNRRIFLMASDGSQVRPLTAGPVDTRPEWSSDSKQIVFMRSINFRSALFRADVETGEAIQLTDYSNDLDPDWSPDGERILFTTSRDGFQELYTMSPDGSDLRRLTENEGLNDLQGVYSPDGSMIAYTTNYSVGDDSGEIRVMNADGSGQRHLTDNDRYDHMPVWSPDGTRLAFTSKRFGIFKWDIFVYDLAEDSLHQLTDAPGSFIWPNWSPDGDWIIYRFTNDNSEAGLYMMCADGSDAQELLPDHGYGGGKDLIWLP